jgi:hypothetical protein
MFRNSKIAAAGFSGLLAATVLGVAAMPAAAQQVAFKRLPDWSGIWRTDTRNGTLFDPATADPPDATAQGLGDRMRPPYNPEYEARYEAILAKSRAGVAADPLTSCAPAGHPRMFSLPYQHEFVLRPEGVWHISEYGPFIRRIYTDGKPMPPEDDLWPMWNGYSVGRWEGDVLVVKATSMRADAPFDRTEAPHSDKLKITERWRKVSADSIEVQVVLEDPVAFTRPWHVTRRFKKLPPTATGEPARIDDIYQCGESQRNPVVNGQTQTILADDPPGYVQGAFPDEPKK